jgi:hypothetical protein
MKNPFGPAANIARLDRKAMRGDERATARLRAIADRHTELARAADRAVRDAKTAELLAWSRGDRKLTNPGRRRAVFSRI